MRPDNIAKNSSPGHELRALVQGPGPLERDQAIIRLLASRDRSWNTSAEFEQGLQRLMQSVKSGESPSDRLRAVLALTRTKSVLSKAKRADVAAALKEALESELPTAQGINEGKDRSLVARAIRDTRPEWSMDYAAREVVVEETAEKARSEFIGLLLEEAPSLASALSVLAAIQQEQVPQGKGVISNSARLRRILTAMIPSITQVIREPGDNVGESFVRFIGSFIRDPREIESRTRTNQASGVIVDCLSELVRTHFRLSTEPETYEPIRLIERWYHPASFPRQVSQKLERLSGLLVEGMGILAKQGVADSRLLRTLELLVGKAASRRKLRTLADELSPLENSVDVWLRSGRFPAKQRQTELAEESELRQLDELFGQLLLYHENLKRRRIGLSSQLTQALAAHDPDLRENAERMFLDIDLIAQRIEHIARRRRLSLRGKPGDEVEYSPIDHELTASTKGQRVVRIVEPAVIKRDTSGATSVVAKAQVVPSGNGAD